MSKIIYLGVPAHGHTNPILSVVHELVQRGEEVLCYNSEEFRPQFEGTGATFRAYPPNELTGARLAEVVQGGNLANATALVLRASDEMLPTLLEQLAQEQPDLILFDSLALWGKMASTLLGVPGGASITHFIMELEYSGLSLWELLMMMGTVLPTVPWILRARNRLIRHFGKAAYPPQSPLFPMRGVINLVFTARVLHPDIPLLDDTFHFVGPSIPSQSPDSIPFEIPDGQPVIYLSLGTIHHASVEFYRDCFQTFADYPAHFIVSAGRQTNMATLGTIPANFTVRSSMPQVALLQRTTAFITHGGMNSVHEGLYYGVPLVIVPHQFEQLMTARLIERQGAAIVVTDQMRRGRFSATQLKSALDQLLATPTYQTAARKIQSILRETGGYRQAADAIQAYLRSR